MAITTYAELKTALGNWLNRADLSDRLPEFIALAEARFRRDLRDWLRFSVSLTNLTGDTLLAATVSEVLGVAMNDGPSGANNYALDLVTREEYQRFLHADANVGSPTRVFPDFDADAGTTTLRFWPPASASAPVANLRVEAVKVLPALSDSQTTNALLREAPDVYLKASLAEAAEYLMHDERVAMWQAEATAGIRGLRIQSERRLYGGTPRPRPLPVVFT
jgi:hypothetical protein